MLSKIKALPAQEPRSNITSTNEPVDDAEDQDIDNDTNNNHKNNLNNIQPIKKEQDELLDIVELSRKRRLSEESANSLAEFIRWSFSHIDPSIQQLAGDFCSINNNNNQQHDYAKHLLRHHAKLSNSESSATNLAMMRGQQDSRSSLNLSSLLSEAASRGAAQKRARTQAYSPEPKYSPTNLSVSPTKRPSSGFLGNVVDRLHHHKQQQQQQQQQQLHLQQQQQLRAAAAQEAQLQDIDQPEGSSNPNLSHHLQQFLRQQTSLDYLCSSVGLEESNQLVLAAAIHRALIDSVGPNQAEPADSKSTASSTGSSSGRSSNTTGTNRGINLTSSVSSSGANMHLADSMNRQRRVYNTRAALHGLGPQMATQHKQRQAINGQTNAQNLLSLSNRAQQQWHAQAAVTLSALSSGAHQLHSLGQPGIGGAGSLVDFKCDTCPSSFDDRHRLMQHQSIHLELKKDWFTETPVDEVMKIFNRRRGEFLCNICNLRFEATLDYDQHNHQIHGPRPYCCQFCGNGTRTFKCWRQYLNHLYDHRYIFSCTIDDCDFTVNRRDSLRFHIFRFHLNCQLPQNQSRVSASQQLQLASNNNNSHHHQHHHQNNNLLKGASQVDELKQQWPHLEDNDEEDIDLGDDGNQNEGERENDEANDEDDNNNSNNNNDDDNDHDEEDDDDTENEMNVAD